MAPTNRYDWLGRLAAAALAAVSLVPAACSNDQTIACATNTTACTNDGDCCSGYCELTGTTAVCAAKPAELPACLDDGNACTQDRNCCGGACSYSCTVSTSGGVCSGSGSPCTTATDCCSELCVISGTTGACR